MPSALRIFPPSVVTTSPDDQVEAADLFFPLSLITLTWLYLRPMRGPVLGYFRVLVNVRELSELDFLLIVCD